MAETETQPKPPAPSLEPTETPATPVDNGQPNSQTVQLPRPIVKPIVKKTRWPYPLIWFVPLLMAAAADYYWWDYLQELGVDITIKFQDVGGLKEDETLVMHRGVTIGRVISVELTPDKHQALAHIRLLKSQDAFAHGGSLFWIVRPEISDFSIKGLNTVLSGPYIDAIAGEGSPTTEFTGLERAPEAVRAGLNIVLHAKQLSHLQADSPVFYKEVQVGAVQSVSLSPDASSVDIHLVIRQRYRPLVRVSSKFWVAAGADVKGGLFSGVEVKVDSLRALLSGGINFATPNEDMGDMVPDGAQFDLEDEVDKDWLKWSPHIALGQEQPEEQSSEGELPNGQQALHSAMQK